jgi:excisionase family DNA binding protein
MSTNPPVLDDYVTRDELAEQLGVSVRTIIRWCDYGDGPPVTAIGRKRLFYRPAVAAWLAKHQRAAA